MWNAKIHTREADLHVLVGAVQAHVVVRNELLLAGHAVNKVLGQYRVLTALVSKDGRNPARRAPGMTASAACQGKKQGTGAGPLGGMDGTLRRKKKKKDEFEAEG